MKAEIPADVTTLVKGNNAFAHDLYDQLREQEGNLCFSPYSLSTALAMTYVGARSETANQMVKVLHFTLDPQRLHSAFHVLMAGLKVSDQQDYQLSVANRLWGQQGYDLLDAFLEITKVNYGAALEQVDFANATESARCTINRWVAQQTQEKIQNLIPENFLDELTRLVLTNAIYFKGNWASQFDETNTREDYFSVTSDQLASVPMMYQEAMFRYASLERLEVLELAYVGNKLSMLILLPREIDGLTELEQQLTPANLQLWLSSLSEVNVKVWLPKFRVNSAVSLKQVLSNMGMSRAFSSEADFSGITGNKDLQISAVLHEARVDISEQGTEAAAATAVALVPISLSTPRTFRFRADHPFIFLIRENQLGSILFLGRVVNPLA